MGDDHRQAAADEQKGHQGHQQLAELPHPLDAAHQHNGRHRRQHHPHRQAVRPRQGVEGGGDGVGLGQVAAAEGLADAQAGVNACQAL